MFTPVLYCFLCQRFCLAHEFVQMRDRWFNADAFELRFPLSIEKLTRHDTVCPDCKAQYHLVPTDDRRSE